MHSVHRACALHSLLGSAISFDCQSALQVLAGMVELVFEAPDRENVCRC